MFLDITLWFHILTGGAGIVAGVCALATTKGSRRHIQWGIAFWWLMLAMAMSGIVLALAAPKAVFMFISVLSVYLINTGRNALTRKSGVVNRATWIWFSVALVSLLAGAGLGIRSLLLGVDVFGSPWFLYFGVAFDALIFVVLDGLLLARGRATGHHRIIDHLWRMIAALFFAMFALLVANPQVFPDWFLNSGLNYLPLVILLGVMAYWVVKTRRRYRRASADFDHG